MYATPAKETAAAVMLPLLLLALAAAGRAAAQTPSTCVTCATDADCTGALADFSAALGVAPGGETCTPEGLCAITAPQSCSAYDPGVLGFMDFATETTAASVFREYDPSGHAFFCSGCFGSSGACPISAVQSPGGCSRWRVVDGSATVFAENAANGTAILRGDVVNECDAAHRLNLDIRLSGRVFVPAGAAGAPAGSPKSPRAGEQDFTYYTATDFRAVGLGALDGLRLAMARNGPAFQVGVGANDKDVDMGASGWLTGAVVESQPAAGACEFEQGRVVDLNVDLENGRCLITRTCGDPPIVTECDCDTYAVDCGCPVLPSKLNSGKCVSLRFDEPLDPDNLSCTPRRQPCPTTP